MGGQIQISQVTGFGWSPQRGPQKGPDGTDTFTYRYLPPGLWNQDGEIVRASINAAAKFFSTFDQFPPDLIPNLPERGTPILSDEGERFYRSCPLYAVMEAKKPYLVWRQFRPDGTSAYEGRSGSYDTLTTEVIRDWPMDEWAATFLKPWDEMLSVDPKAGRRAMFMQRGLRPGAPKDVDTEGWAKEYDNPRADVHERTEFPWGLFKVMLVSCPDERAEECMRYEFDESYRLMPSALAVRKGDTGTFEWREHHVWRIETAVQLLPRTLKWMEDEGHARARELTVRSISPCYAWEFPEVHFVENPGSPEWDVIAVFYKPLAELDELALARHEHDLANLPRPPRP